METTEGTKRPQPQVSPDVRFFDQKTVGRELVRWVFSAADLITKRRKDEIEWLAAGGEELSSPCLFRYGRGYLPRAFVTPIEQGAEFIAKDALPPGTDAQTGIEVNGVVIQSNLVQIPVYPGDALVNIQFSWANDQGRHRGGTEITSLKGKKWGELRSFDPSNPGYLDILDRVYFGDGREPTLRGLEEQIKQGRKGFPESSGQADEMLMACGRFRDWALNRLEQEHVRIKSTPTPGAEAQTYSPLGELLLVQLEVQRQDQPLQSMAEMNTHMARQMADAISQNQGGGFDMERFAQIMTLNGEQIAKRVAQEVAIQMGAEGEKKEHHKTREARERREAAERATQVGDEG